MNARITTFSRMTVIYWKQKLCTWFIFFLFQILEVECQSHVTTIAGDVPGYVDGENSLAKFSQPAGVAISPDSKWLAVADSGNNVIRKINFGPKGFSEIGLIETLSGSGFRGLQDGSATTARFNSPFSVAFSPDGSWLAVADRSNQAIRKVLLTGNPAIGCPDKSTCVTNQCLCIGDVYTLAGSIGGFQDGTGSSIQFLQPFSISFLKSVEVISKQSTQNSLIVSDQGNNRIRTLIVTSTTGSQVVGQVSQTVISHVVTSKTLAGQTGQLSFCSFGTVQTIGLCNGGTCLCGGLTPKDNTLYSSYSPRIQYERCGSAIVNPQASSDLNNLGNDLSEACEYGAATPVCSTNAAGSNCQCLSPNTGASCTSSSQCTQGGICLGIAGYIDGSATTVQFNGPSGVAVSPEGSYVFIADSNNQVIRKISISDGETTTFVGTQGVIGNQDSSAQAAAATFSNPMGLTVSPDGLWLVIADTNNNRLRLAVQSGTVSSLTGMLDCLGGAPYVTGACWSGAVCSCKASAVGGNPVGSCSDGTEKIVCNGCVQCVCNLPNTGAACNSSGLCSGGGQCSAASNLGLQDGVASKAQFDQPIGLAISSDGTVVFVADSHNNAVRALNCTGSCLGTPVVFGAAGSATGTAAQPLPSCSSPAALAVLWLAVWLSYLQCNSWYG